MTARRWGPLTAVSLGAFMLLLDITIVNVALPEIGADLGASFAQLQWVVDGYAMVLAATLLTCGATADRVGRRRMYLIGLSIFGAASLACGLAPGIEALIAARALQGIGGACMYATTLALLSHSYQGRDRAIAFGVWGSVNGLATALGPVLGGLLTHAFGWRSVFLVNVPVVVLTAAITRRRVGESRDPVVRRTDRLGALTFMVALAALVYGLIRVNETGWAAPGTLALFAVSAAGLVAFVAVERRVAHPMLDLAVMRTPAMAGISVAAVTMHASAFAFLIFASIWMQAVLGMSAVATGLVLAPLSLTSLLASLLAGRYLANAAPRTLTGGGLLIVAAGAAMMTVLRADSGWIALIPGTTVIGIGVGLAAPSISSTALAVSPRGRAGMAAGANTTFRQMGVAVGIAVLGVVFHSAMASALRGRLPDPERADGLARALAAGGVRQATPEVGLDTVREAFAAGLTATFVVSALVALGGAVVALTLIRVPAGHRAEPEPELEPALAQT